MSRRSWRHARIDAAGMAACAALSTAFYVLGVAPIQARRAAEQAGSADLAALDAEAARVRAEFAAVRQALDDARERRGLSPLVLERADRMNSRMAQLNALARANGLEIDEIKPGSAQDGTWFTRVPVSISGNGPYRAGMLFLHQLNRQFPDMGLSALEVRGDPSTDDTPAIFMFDLVWYAAARATADAAK